MTVPATTRRAGPFTGNGVTTSFPFTFKTFDTEDVAVTLTGTDTLELTLVLDSDYSVTLNGDQDASPGGSITYPISGTPLAVGEKLTAVGAVPYDQTADLPTGGSFSPVVIENALDRATNQIQQLAEELGRSLTLPPSAAGADTTLPVPEANKVIGWNAAANALVNLDSADLASVVVAGTAYTDIFDGTGAQVDFALTSNPGGVNALDISISGVSQVNGVDFTVSGTTLTFTSAPPAATGNICVRYVAALPVGTTNAQDVLYDPAGGGAVRTTVQAKLRESVSVVDKGADPTGVADSAAAFALAFAGGGRVIIPAGSYKISAPVSMASNTEVVGYGLPTLTSSAAGKHIFSGVSLTNVSVRGVSFVGTGSSTVPTVSVGGYAASISGLVTFASCTNVTVENCLFDAFHNGVSTINCVGLNITRNRVTNWMLYGVLASLSDRFTVDHNYIVGCNQTGAANGYGVSATGDENGGNSQEACSISFNTIRGIPSWDGIMTHDVSGLRVIGNDIRDVRIGIDLGHNIATNKVRDLIVALNYIESTTTNTWGATPGAHNGILVTGYDASNLVDGATIIGNEIKNFFQTAGMVSAGGPSHITVQFCDRAVIQGNRVRNGGAVIGASGIYVVGGNNGLVVSGNSVEGTMAPGGIRLASVTAETATITGNSIKQTNTADRGVYITGSTITGLAVGDNATNSTTPFSSATSTLTMAANDIVGTFTLGAAITSTVANTNVTAGCTILLTPTNAAAATLQGSAKCLYISARTAATSFAVSTANGVAAAGTETFAYRISY